MLLCADGSAWGFQEEEIPPELRSQRTLNRSRIPEIANYILLNRSEYIFSAITASVDGTLKFDPLTVDGLAAEDVGKLRVSMDSRVIINDGQHRRAAIEQALRDSPDLGDETISVVFFHDVGLKRTQQMFADLNKHAVRPTRSLGIFYDHRDPLSSLAKIVVDRVDVFRYLTEVEKTTISNRSIKLFTLSGIYQGILSLLRKTQYSKEVTEKEVEVVVEFWQCVCDSMKDWKLAAARKVSSYELRQDYVHAHALALHAIGRLGAALLSTNGRDYKKELKKLAEIDWSRKNLPLWGGRAMIAGKISKSHNSVILTTNLLKKQFGLALTPEEKSVEVAYLKKA